MMNTIFEFIWAFVLATLTAMCLLAMTMMAMALFGYTPAMFAAEASEAKNLDDVHAASCRVVCSNPNAQKGAIGTGTVIARTAGRYWILTNWHVVNGFSNYKCQFARDGKLVSVPARLQKSWHNETAPYDFAILTVEESELAEYNPPIVPLAGAGTQPLTDRAIFSSGCSEGRWPMAWKGSVESYYGKTAQFYPAPKGGQSGSSIVQQLDDGLRVTGILTWRVGDERNTGEEAMRGGAIPISHFYQAASGRRPTGHERPGDSVPPFSSWCTAETADPCAESPEAVPLSISHPIQDAASYFSNKCAPDKSDLELFYFTTPGCIPCLNAKPIVASLVNEGYLITTVDTGTESGAETAKQCDVRIFPTFLLCRRHEDHYEGLERWVGIESLEAHIRQVFSKHAKKGLPPAPKRKATEQAVTTEPAKKDENITEPATNSESATREVLDAARRRSAPKNTPGTGNLKTPNPGSGSTGSGDSSGSGDGDISPLLDVLPGAEQEDEEKPDAQTVPAKPRSRTPAPKAESESASAGLVGSVADKLAARLEKRFDALGDKIGATAEKVVKDKIADITPDITAAIKDKIHEVAPEIKTIVQDKITEITPEIRATIRDYLAKVFVWVVVIIVASWYTITLGVRLLASALKWGWKKIPTVHVQFDSCKKEKNDISE